MSFISYRLPVSVALWWCWWWWCCCCCCWWWWCWVPVNSSHGQLVTDQNCMTSWPAAETPCCDELTGASNAVLSLLWRVKRMLLSALTPVLCSIVPILTTLHHWVWNTLVPWTTEKLVWAAVTDSHDHTLFCSLHVQWAEHCVCFVVHFVFSQFLVHFYCVACNADAV